MCRILFLHKNEILVKNTSMLNLMIRFVFIYFFLIFSMKLMGKRQIGQLQMSELISAFFLSELATYTVTDDSIPLLFGIIPIVLLICLEVIVSYLTVKIPLLKKIFDFAPSFLISWGKVSQKELEKNRMTIDELFSQLRLCGYEDLSRVKFAILESNGQLSVVPFPEAQSVSISDLNLPFEELGFSLALINDGMINQKALTFLSKNNAWLQDELRKRKIASPEEVFLLVSNFSGITHVVLKEAK